MTGDSVLNTNAAVRYLFQSAPARDDGRIDLRIAVIANEQQFTLVRWRDILERFRGREVAGLVRGMGGSWQLGLQQPRPVALAKCPVASLADDCPTR